ncbi:MAG: hypothetical protein Q8N98_03330, partial [bacterium]|nr:hypothetical protein [bacterium]
FTGTSDMWGEFLPAGANLEKLKQEKLPPKIEFSDDKTKAEELIVKSNKISFSVLAAKETAVTVNTFYFPGWQAYSAGEKIPLDEKMSKETGLIVFPLPAGRHDIVVKFEETPVRKIGNIISALTLLGMIMLLLLSWFCSHSFRRAEFNSASVCDKQILKRVQDDRPKQQKILNR